MKVPISWLKDYVDIDHIVDTDADMNMFIDALTLSGSKVEAVERPWEEISRIVVGKIISVEKHPNADKLIVVKVDVGNEEVQIVTGAMNVSTDDYVPVALHGSTLPGGAKIKKGKLRGVESRGMLCSLQELSLDTSDYPGQDEDGIFILEPGKEKEYKCGQDIKEVLDLNQTIIEFEITSNRPDCLGILGIARETAATLKKPLRKPIIKVREEEDEASEFAQVKIEDPDLCPRYAARIIKDVKIEPSPSWMRKRLRTAGIRPINNIVDVTNYVMLELGQPMHAFDLRYIDEGEIVVRRAKNDEFIKTLDGEERKLDTSMLVIADSNKPVAVAGVMGGENSEVYPDTKTILLESANFNGVSVRLTAKKLGMRTEASGRFEKGLDVENVITAIDRAAQLIEKIGGGRVCKGIIDCYPVKKERKTLKLRPERINALLGTSLGFEAMIEILESLEIKVDKDTMDVTVPGFRQDIEREADLAEEIARMFDYNNIQATLLPGKELTVGKKSYKQIIEDLIKNTMISCGLSEIYTYSFTSPRIFDKIKAPEGSLLRNAITISNPLGEDYSIMRTTTLPEMMWVISRNYNRKVEEAGLFELSYVYIPKEQSVQELPEERPVLTIGMYGNIDFFNLKGIIEEMLNGLRIENYRFVSEINNPTFHPGRTARLLINEADSGVFGEIHPDVAEEFAGPKRTYIGMINVEPLIREANMSVQYKPLPKFPSLKRDIAILLNEDIMAQDIKHIIEEKGGKILEQIELFDVYKGKQVPEGMKSMAYSLIFRAEDKTLTDEEANKAIDKIIYGLKDSFNAKLRE